MADFDQLTQYMYTDADGTVHIAAVVRTDAPAMPMPVADTSDAPAPTPTLDERITAVESVVDALTGGV